MILWLLACAAPVDVQLDSVPACVSGVQTLRLPGLPLVREAEILSGDLAARLVDGRVEVLLPPSSASHQSARLRYRAEPFGWEREARLKVTRPQVDPGVPGGGTWWQVRLDQISPTQAARTSANRGGLEGRKLELNVKACWDAGCARLSEGGSVWLPEDPRVALTLSDTDAGFLNQKLAGPVDARLQAGPQTVSIDGSLVELQVDAYAQAEPELRELGLGDSASGRLDPKSGDAVVGYLLELEHPALVHFAATSSEDGPRLSLHRCDGAEIAQDSGYSGARQLSAELQPGLWALRVGLAPLSEGRSFDVVATEDEADLREWLRARGVAEP